MKLEGQTILVTGAAGAIGREICLMLADNGASLAMVDRVFEPLASIEHDLATRGAAVASAAIDGADLSAMTTCLEDLQQAVGQVDAVVNVAGYFAIEEFSQTDAKDWQRMISANLYTAMASCRAVLPNMIERGRGTIVNFASTAGEYGSIRPSAAYAAAKGGVIAFSKSLAREVSPRGVRVNCVSPGPIDTSMFQAGGHADRSEAASRTLLGRMGRPGDLASAVLYLVSDDSAFITGEVLRVNGGSLL